MGSVYKRKDSSKWWIQYRLGGQLKRRAGGSTKREAERLLARIETDIYNGTHFPDRQHSTLTIGSLCERWLAQAQAKRSLSTDKQRFATIVEYFGPTTLLTTLRAEDVEGLKATLRKRTNRQGAALAPATVNRHLALLKTALNFAVENQYLQRNPMSRVKMLQENNQRDRVCEDGELALLLDHAGPALRLAIQIAHSTGMRMGEIVALTWRDIDFKNALIHVRGATSKTGMSRVLPMDSALKNTLEIIPRSLDGRLFKVDRRTLSPSFKRLCRKLSIENLRFHDLRHTAATRWRRNGVDLFTMATLTGHQDLATLRRYNTITLEDKRIAIEKGNQPLTARISARESEVSSSDEKEADVFLRSGRAI